MTPPDTRTDADLVHAANAGDATAFEMLYARYRDWTVRLAFRFTRDEHDALDVLQDTFTYLLRKFPGFKLTAQMTTFLYPVVRHLALARLRKRRHLSDDEALAQLAQPAPTDLATQHADLASLLASLPAPQREVVLMRFVDDMTLPEIAQALEIPLGTVKSRLHNALATLRTDPSTQAYWQP